MKKLINGIIYSPATTGAGLCGGIVQIKEGIETKNWVLILSGVSTILLGIFSRDAKVVK